jgi:hypothetical protein
MLQGIGEDLVISQDLDLDSERNEEYTNFVLTNMKDYANFNKFYCLSTEKVFILQSVLEMSVLVNHDRKKCQEFVR